MGLYISHDFIEVSYQDFGEQSVSLLDQEAEHIGKLRFAIYQVELGRKSLNLCKSQRHLPPSRASTSSSTGFSTLAAGAVAEISPPAAFHGRYLKTDLSANNQVVHERIRSDLLTMMVICDWTVIDNDNEQFCENVLTCSWGSTSTTTATCSAAKY